MGRAFKIGFALFLLMLFILGIVLLTLPASVAYRLGAERLPPGFSLSGLQGSIWNGSADAIIVKDIALGTLRWQIDKTSPFVANVVLEGSGASGSATVDLARRDVYQARNVVINAPGQVLQKALGLPGFEFTGAITGNLQTVAVQYPTRIQAAGEITWTDAGIALPFGLRLGTFVLVLEPTETGARGTISDRGGDLALNGTVEWIGARYLADVRLQARGGPPELARALSYVGAMNQDGSRQLRVEGDLL